MASQELSQVPPEEEQTKKPSKKEVAKAEKLRRRQEAAAVGVGAVTIDAPDPLATNYGDIALEKLLTKLVSGKVWTTVMSLMEELNDRTVLIRGRAHTIRPVSKKMTFVVVREKGFTVQFVLTVAPYLVSMQMVKFTNALSRESFIDIEGIVSVPDRAITGAT